MKDYSVIGNNILVKTPKTNGFKEVSGFYINEGSSINDTLNIGEIIEVGSTVVTGFLKQKIVIFSKLQAAMIEDDDEFELFVIKETDILAIEK